MAPRFRSALRFRERRFHILDENLQPVERGEQGRIVCLRVTGSPSVTGTTPN